MRVRLLVTMVGLASTVTLAQNPQPFRLMSEDRDKAYRQLFPKVTDIKLQKILKSPELLLYTEAEIPRAHQDWEGDLKGIHSSYNNVSANQSEPFGNGNRELPWNSAAGTDNTNTETFRFIWLPTDEKGNKRPIVWYQSNPIQIFDNVQAMQAWSWVFPVGAIVGEALCLPDSNNNKYVYELRTRIRHHDKWTVAVYRPFPTAKDLSAAIKSLRNDWQKDQSLVNCIYALNSPLNDDKYVFEDNQRNRVFSETRSIDTLPPIDETLVRELLKQPFKLVNGVVWKGEGKFAPHAPTTNARFHIVPANYKGGFIGVNSQSCMNCHQTTNDSVSKFNSNRDWYGRIRGSDGIFSFHVFDRSCISGSGYNQGVSMNQSMVNAGIIAGYDPAKHQSSVYYKITDH